VGPQSPCRPEFAGFFKDVDTDPVGETESGGDIFNFDPAISPLQNGVQPVSCQTKVKRDLLNSSSATLS
jgi:hypothetical protein